MSEREKILELLQIIEERQAGAPAHKTAERLLGLMGPQEVLNAIVPAYAALGRALAEFLLYAGRKGLDKFLASIEEALEDPESAITLAMVAHERFADSVDEGL